MAGQLAQYASPVSPVNWPLDSKSEDGEHEVRHLGRAAVLLSREGSSEAAERWFVHDG